MLILKTKTVGPVALLFSFILIGAVAASLAKSSSPARSSAKAAVKMPAVTKTTGKSTSSSPEKSATKDETNALAAVEELSGTISFVGPSDKEFTLLGQNGVPYDFHLTAMSKIDSAGTKIARSELTSESHKQATINFLPTKQGNLVKRVEISG